MLVHEQLTEHIIGAAIEVHRELGPGLLESAYEQCFCHELHLRDLAFQCQLALPVVYKGLKLDCGYRLDVVVDDSVVIELKSVEQILPDPSGTAAHIFASEWQEGGADNQF